VRSSAKQAAWGHHETHPKLQIQQLGQLRTQKFPSDAKALLVLVRYKCKFLSWMDLACLDSDTLHQFLQLLGKASAS
jgi:hypothetical protein